jgi:hypothetical protein
MKKSITAILALGMVMVLSGCPIWIETEPVDGPDCDWGCSAGCVSDAECGDGYICNASGVCVPEPVGPVICESDDECDNGYCDIPDGSTAGLCVETGTCTDPDDCAVYGPGLTCDDRGICVPEEAPCPDGECGCIDDSECGDGTLCIDSRCTDLATICLFDFECGEGTCVDNKCHSLCVGGPFEVSCPVGQGCSSGICMDLELGLDQCVFDEDCGAEGSFRCINATCHPTCGDVEECGYAEACTAGICRADVAPVHECTTDGGECSEDMECIRGKCRMPCAVALNCADQGEMTECIDNVCMSVAEVDALCVRAADCEDGASCHNGQCVTFQ